MSSRLVAAASVAALLACGGQATSTTPSPSGPPSVTAVRTFVEGARLLATGRAKDLDPAQKTLEKALSMDGRLWEAAYDLGIVHRRKGSLEAARASFELATSLAPEQRAPIVGLAECEADLGDVDRAASRVTAHLKTHADDTSLRLLLSALERRRGNGSAALAQARAVLAKDPKNVGALVEVARVYRARGERDVAILVLGKAASFAPNDPVVSHELGLVALDEGDTQLAFEQFRKAVSADARFTTAHLNQGAVLLHAGDYAGAEQAYRAALGSSSASRDARLGLGIALRGRGQHAAAKKQYEAVIEENPFDAQAWFDLGLLEADFMQRPEAAIVAFEKFLALATRKDSLRGVAERYLQDLRMAPQGAEGPS